ncbi:hypothetical protein D917_10530 [Trichinella nativa]|uniref:Uncharacterized protein n=1 Tax=Trichinella nativa TaxID=6335 RepID=A0A1Y3EFS7_9BILA|nr:hypothetical protein D917_10530 [Trichinella nativa]
MEEYVDELESLAESVSDEDHVEEEGIFSRQCPSTRTIPWSEHPIHPSRRSAEDLLRDNPRPTGKCKAAMTTEDVFKPTCHLVSEN